MTLYRSEHTPAYDDDDLCPHPWHTTTDAGRERPYESNCPECGDHADPELWARTAGVGFPDWGLALVCVCMVLCAITFAVLPIIL